ncbi:MAG: ATP-binding cassette domain-containing protein [Planctomycetota bacterium]|nr:MAG: ATP-binding cassette domain-containing protein [Planctomycetota bacterium]
MASISLKQLCKNYDGNDLAVDHLSLDIKDGEFLVLVGPSGCGKSTALRMVAGLEDISGGDLFIADKRVNDLTPRQRNIAMVFQSYALYPSKTVYDNIAFPLRMQGGISKADMHQRVMAVVESLELGEYLGRLPKAMSGGQRQRVAMARALVREPVAFLMDEPLSNLDAKLRVQMRSEILELQRRTRTTTLYVTHDQVEAMTMGDRVAVLDYGVLQQVAPPQELYRYPANIFVATFIGSPSMTLWQPTWQPHEGDLGLHLVDRFVSIPREVCQRWGGAEAMAQAAQVGLRPEHWRRANTQDGLSVEVLSVEHLGHEQLISFALPPSVNAADNAKSARGQARLDSQILHHVGEHVMLQPDLSQLHCFDVQGKRCPDAECTTATPETVES